MRRVRVDDRSVAAVAVVAGLASTLSDVSPTGSPVPDSMVTFLAVSISTWAAASAPWWALLGATGFVSLIALGPVPLSVGLLATALAMWISLQQRSSTVWRSVAGGAALNVACWADLDAFFGASASVGIGAAVLLLVSGVMRRKRTVQRRVLVAAGVTAGVVAVVSLLTMVAALSARGDASRGRELIEAGIASLRDGEYTAAVESLTEARGAFESASTTMGRPWLQPARLVPVLAQHRAAVADISTASAIVADDLGATAAVIDVDALTIRDGRFDLGYMEAISEPVRNSFESLVSFRATLDDVMSPWLLATAEETLTSASDEFDEHINQFEHAVTALELAPRILGGQGERSYFVAFTTPAEARGLGGFMGNYAVITANDGKLTMGEFGRTRDLNLEGASRVITGPADWLARWGRFGFTNGADGSTGDVPWSNITMSAHFPSTAQVIAELFPQSGGFAVDGVIAMDPEVLRALVGFTGPISIELPDATTVRLDESNVLQFLLYDQYTIDTDGRTDILDTVARATFDELLGGALPAPSVLARDLGPLTDVGRLVGWMHDPTEQALFASIGLDGGLPHLDPNDSGTDGFEVVINNAGANKLDAFLERDIVYTASIDPATDYLMGELTITLTNRAPTSGLPDGVIGNYVGDPIGTNRSLLTIYSVHPVDSVSINADPAGVESGIEAGWRTATTYVTTPAGGTTTIVMQMVSAEPIDPSSYHLIVRTQPLVDTPTYTIDTPESR